VVEERWRYTKKMEKLFGQIETDRLLYVAFQQPAKGMQKLCNVNQQNAFPNSRFNSILLVFDMFRTSYVHLQEDCIVHAALYFMFSMLKLQ
jgi:hypothetical protein